MKTETKMSWLSMFVVLTGLSFVGISPADAQTDGAELKKKGEVKAAAISKGDVKETAAAAIENEQLLKIVDCRGEARLIDPDAEKEKARVDAKYDYLLSKVVELTETLDEMQMRIDELEGQLAAFEDAKKLAAELRKGKNKAAVEAKLKNASSRIQAKYRYKSRFIYDETYVRKEYYTDEGEVRYRTQKERDRKKIGVRCFVINDAKQEARLVLTMSLHNSSKTRVYAHGIESTPMLEPGEVYEFTKWFKVDDCRRVKQITVDDVQAYTEPREEQLLIKRIGH